MGTFDNLYLNQIKKLQEENTRLKQVLREYDFDSYMATAEMEPFDPKNPRARRPSTGIIAADVLHDHFQDAYERGFIRPRGYENGLPLSPKHPIEMDELELVNHTDKLLRATDTEQHRDILNLVGHVIAQHPTWNLDLQNFGGVRNQRGVAFDHAPPSYSLERLRMLQGFGLVDSDGRWSEG